jgi:predicted RND superfamily exporter protein
MKMNYENFIIRYRWWLIIAPFVITLLAAIPLLNTRINPDLEKYLPDDTPAMLSKAKIDSLFGNSDPVIIIFETDDVLNPNTLNRVKSISKSLNRTKEFEQVISLFDTKNIKSEYGAMIVDPVVKRIPKTNEKREELREEIKHNELAYKLVVSEDFTKTVLILKVAPGISDNEIIELVDQALDEFPGDETVYKGGTPYLRVQVNNDISKDMLILMPLGLLIMILFLILSFREIRGVILPFLVVSMSIVISLGFFPLMGWELSIITILAPIMMIAIANNYGVHFIARYQELNAGHPEWSMKDITREVLLKLKKPVIITGLTTIAGIMGLIVHILLPAQQLGVAASLGIAFALILSVTFIPAMMAIQKKGKVLKSLTHAKSSPIDRILSYFANISTTRPIIVLFVFGSFLLFAGAGIAFLHVDSNSENFLPPSHPFRQATAITNEDFGGTKYLTVLFEGDMKDPELLKRMDHYESVLESNPMIGSVTSIASMIKIMSRSLNEEGEPFYNKIPGSRNAIAQYPEVYAMSGDPEDFEGFVNFDYTQALMIVQFRADTKNALDDIIEEVDLLTKDDPNRSLIGGYCLVDKELSEAVVNGQYNSLIFAIGIIAFLLILIFKSFNSGWLGSLPLVYTVIALFGTMGWIGIKLDIATAMLSSIAIGIGVDYTIHFFWRYKQELELGKSYPEAITTTLRTTGRGIAINAFSVIMGFVILFVSSFLTIKYFAFLIIFSVLLCLLCALILIPSLCMLIKPKFLETNHLKK